MFIAGAGPSMARRCVAHWFGRSLIVATQISERMGRLSAFLHPQHFKEDAGLQQMQALIAWGSGGMEGLGLGNGRQKMLYLPHAHTDFIFPIVGEELGLRFSLLVVFLFVVIIGVRHYDCATRQGSFRPAPGLRSGFAPGSAGRS